MIYITKKLNLILFQMKKIQINLMKNQKQLNIIYNSSDLSDDGSNKYDKKNNNKLNNKNNKSIRNKRNNNILIKIIFNNGRFWKISTLQKKQANKNI